MASFRSVRSLSAFASRRRPRKIDLRVRGKAVEGKTDGNYVTFVIDAIPTMKLSWWTDELHPSDGGGIAPIATPVSRLMALLAQI